MLHMYLHLFPFIPIIYMLKLISTSNSELCLSCIQRRGELENHSVDAASTSEAVGFITLMQELKRQVRSWEQKVEVRNSKL